VTPPPLIYRANGARLGDGISVDRAVTAKGDAAIADAAKLFAKAKP